VNLERGRRRRPDLSARRRRDDSSACLAVEDLLKLAGASRQAFGVLDARALAGRAAREFGPIVGTDATAVGLREAADLLVVRAGWRIRSRSVRTGLEVPSGDGVGGKILCSGQPMAVADYGTAPQVSERLVDDIVRREGVHALLGVPLSYRGQVVGVLYAVNRSPGEIGDRAWSLAVEFAASLGPALGAAMHSARAARLSALAERQRLSRDLHDNLSPLLFGIGAAAQQAGRTLAAEGCDLLPHLRSIEEQASRAAASLREILCGLAPSVSEEGLPAILRMDVAGFATFTGLATDFVVIGEPHELSGEQESVLLAVVREGLHNVGKHARASTALVTLHYGMETVDVLVQDDGCGLPEGFTITDVPHDGRHQGLASLSQRLARVGGQVILQGNEDGGMTLCASLPTGECRRAGTPSGADEARAAARR
jgi:signal transduction histidine kinase